MPFVYVVPSDVENPAMVTVTFKMITHHLECTSGIETNSDLMPIHINFKQRLDCEKNQLDRYNHVGPRSSSFKGYKTVKMNLFLKM